MAQLNTYMHGSERYYKVPGVGWVPSVTTVLQVVAKPRLLEWYGALGNEEAGRQVEKAKDIGKTVHMAVEEYIRTGREPAWELEDGLPAFSPEAESALRAFLAWHRENPLRFEAEEKAVWSTLFRYAGTLDALGLAYLGGEPVLCEWKTSKAVYPEHVLQVSAYRWALYETHGLDVKKALILRLDKEGKGFEAHWCEDDALREAFTAFLNVLEVWRWLKKFRNEWAGGPELPKDPLSSGGRRFA